MTGIKFNASNTKSRLLTFGMLLAIGSFVYAETKAVSDEVVLLADASSKASPKASPSASHTPKVAKETNTVYLAGGGKAEVFKKNGGFILKNIQTEPGNDYFSKGITSVDGRVVELSFNSKSNPITVSENLVYYKKASDFLNKFPKYSDNLELLSVIANGENEWVSSDRKLINYYGYLDAFSGKGNYIVTGRKIKKTNEYSPNFFAKLADNRYDIFSKFNERIEKEETIKQLKAKNAKGLKELEQLKAKNAKGLKELEQLKAKNAKGREELEQMKAKNAKGREELE